MGLDCSHDAFSGAYSAFGRFRHVVGKAFGGSYPPHDDPALDPDAWYWPKTVTSRDEWPGLAVFFSHSDCDGDIPPDVCSKLADELETLLPAIATYDMHSDGHIARNGGYSAVTQRFIDGCLRGADANEPLLFA